MLLFGDDVVFVFGILPCFRVAIIKMALVAV